MARAGPTPGRLVLQHAWGVTVSYAHAKKRSLTPRVGVGTLGGGFDGNVNGAVEPAKEGEGTLAAASACSICAPRRGRGRVGCRRGPPRPLPSWSHLSNAAMCCQRRHLLIGSQTRPSVSAGVVKRLLILVCAVWISQLEPFRASSPDTIAVRTGTWTWLRDNRLQRGRLSTLLRPAHGTLTVYQTVWVAYACMCVAGSTPLRQCTSNDQPQAEGALAFSPAAY